MKSKQGRSSWKLAVWSLAVGLVAVPACGYGDMDTMSNHSGLFDEHAIDYQAELTSHRATVEAASDLSGIAALEAAHVAVMQPHVSGMRHELGDMMACRGPAGEQPDARAVLTDLDRLQQEHDSHRASMAGAIDTAAARAEEARHQGQVQGMMTDMRSHAGAMMDGTGHFNCPHHGRR